MQKSTHPNASPVKGWWHGVSRDGGVVAEDSRDFAENDANTRVLLHNPPVWPSASQPLYTRGPLGACVMLFFYRTKEVLNVVDHASPGVRMAAWGFSSQRMLPPSGLGRLCQGSMQTNLGMPFLLQISV